MIREEKKNNKLFTGLGSVRIVKTVTSALKMQPSAAFSRPRSQFFTIRTSQPANDTHIYIYIMHLLTEWEGWTGKYLARGHDVRTGRINLTFCLIGSAVSFQVSMIKFRPSMFLRSFDLFVLLSRNNLALVGRSSV